jgi:hypothetical protein
LSNRACENVGIIHARRAQVVELGDRRMVEPHVHVAIGRALVLDVDVAGKRGDCSEGAGGYLKANRCARYRSGPRRSPRLVPMRTAMVMQAFVDDSYD